MALSSLQPVSALSFVFVQILLLLQDVLNPSVSMFFNPQADLSELPLKSFYRYVNIFDVIRKLD